MHHLEPEPDLHQNPKRPIESPPSPSRPAKVPKTLGEGVGGEGGADPKVTMAIPGAQRYLVAVEYVGTRFSGAQKQPNCRTVVGTLEEAFQKFVGQPVSISCSSRTDAGVHALSNVCHVDVVRTSKRKPGEVLPPHEPRVVQRAVNHFLQAPCRQGYFEALRHPPQEAIKSGSCVRKDEGDIMVIDVRCIPADFHARFKAQERTYFYRILSGPELLSVFENGRSWHVPEELDILAMQKACKVLVGCHDFSSFRAAGCQANSPIKTLDELQVSEVPPSPYFPSRIERAHPTSLEDPIVHEIDCGIPQTLIDVQGGLGKCNTTSSFGQRKRHRCFVIIARGRSFLYHQVRLLVGVLKSVGTGDLTVKDVEKILDAKTVTASPPMAPACGLYLGNVRYDLP